MHAFAKINAHLLNTCMCEDTDKHLLRECMYERWLLPVKEGTNKHQLLYTCSSNMTKKYLVAFYGLMRISILRLLSNQAPENKAFT